MDLQLIQAVLSQEGLLFFFNSVEEITGDGWFFTRRARRGHRRASIQVALCEEEEIAENDS